MKTADSIAEQSKGNNARGDGDGGDSSRAGTQPAQVKLNCGLRRAKIDLHPRQTQMELMTMPSIS